MEKLKSLYNEFVNRQTVLYVIFGVLTSVLNVGMFKLLFAAGMDYRLADVITLITVKAVAYLCNKFFVFRSRCPDAVSLIKEIVRYIIARGATMLVDLMGLMLLVDVFRLPELPCKIFITVVVVILNYILGKKHVFKDSIDQ